MNKILLYGITFLLVLGIAVADDSYLCKQPQDMYICLGVQIWDSPMYDYCLRYDLNRDTVIDLRDVTELAQICFSEPVKEVKNECFQVSRISVFV